MNHNELLDYLREHEEYWTSLRAQRWAKVPAFNALRAAVELHKPDKFGFCYCSDIPSKCPTKEAIEKELK